MKGNTELTNKTSASFLQVRRVSLDADNQVRAEEGACAGRLSCSVVSSPQLGAAIVCTSKAGDVCGAA